MYFKSRDICKNCQPKFAGSEYMCNAWCRISLALLPVYQGVLHLVEQISSMLICTLISMGESLYFIHEGKAHLATQPKRSSFISKGSLCVFKLYCAPLRIYHVSSAYILLFLSFVLTNIRVDSTFLALWFLLKWAYTNCQWVCIWSCAVAPGCHGWWLFSDFQIVQCRQVDCKNPKQGSWLKDGCACILAGK